jgi:hypothetical protein
MVDTLELNHTETFWELGTALCLGTGWPIHRLSLDSLLREPVSFGMEPSQVEWDVARQGKAAAVAALRQLDWSRVYWAANVAQHSYHRLCVGEMTSGEVGTHVSKDAPREVTLNHDSAIRESQQALAECTAAKGPLEKVLPVFEEVLARDQQYGSSGATTSSHPRKRSRDEDGEVGPSQRRSTRPRVTFKGKGRA